MHKLTLEAKNENLDAVLGFVHQELSGFLCSPKSLMHLDLAVEEIFVNISQYAYSPGTGLVTVLTEFCSATSEIIVIFIDKGIPYNPLSKEDPDFSLEVKKRPVGGLGIFMTKSVMDNVSYNYKEGRNILRMTKTV